MFTVSILNILLLKLKNLMIHKLPQLKYEYEDLKNVIDPETMEIHHSKHHGGYVSKLNAAIESHEDLQEIEVDTLISKIGELPSNIQNAVRNNGGGHFNHSLFWQIMSPNGGGKPEGKLLEAIEDTFGSFDEFKTKFNEAATTRFGSGWAWLVVNDGGLVITSTPNQDNPLMKGLVEVTGNPILGLDVWEHAYYLKYQNKRADYVEAWWDIVDWDKVSELFIVD